MKVFLTGGTGFLGTDLLPALVAKGYEPTILTRSKKNAIRKFEKYSDPNVIEKISFLEGYPQEKGPWQEKLPEFDIIINLAGENLMPKRWTKKQKQNIIDSRIKSLENIIEVLNKNKGNVKTLVSMSGPAFYPASTDPKVNYREDYPPEPENTGFLGEVTRLWEAPLENLDLSIRHFVFRLGVVFSDKGIGAEKMFIPHKLLIGGRIGSGRQIYSWIHIKDVTRAFIHGLENEQVRGIYNLGAPSVETVTEIAKMGGKVLRRPVWTFAPGFALKLILGERAELLLEGRRIDPTKLIDTGFEFQFTDLEEMLRDILIK